MIFFISLHPECPNANFIFSGSQRHLMSKMFLSPSRPFYQSVVPMSLEPIPFDRYWTFAESQFAKNGGRRITKDVVEEVHSHFVGVSAVKGLLEKDFITETDGEYYVYDHFFRLWMQRRQII